jgi:hypothetical protein
MDKRGERNFKVRKRGIKRLMDDKRMNEYKGSEAIWVKREGDVYAIGQRKGRYDICNMIGSKF